MKTVPMSPELLRDQFSKGASRNFGVGTMSLRLSQSSTATWVSRMSSMTPNSPSTTTVSPMRIGCEKVS